MDKYIDRDALISKKHGCDRKDCSNCDFFTDGDSWCQGEIFVIDVLNAPAADVVERKAGKWIPVTERLPDTMKDKSVYSGWSAEIAPSDDVLCYLGSDKRQTVAWYSHTYKEWTTVDENTVYKYGEVTHWMPLPSTEGLNET